MSIWTAIGNFAHGVGSAGAHLLEKGVDAISGDRATRRSVQFSMAVVALAAKMAKADGVVTTEELQSFWRRFDVADADRKNVERLFRLAQRDVAGFESYAEKIARLFPDDPALLEDIVDILFSIAAADGVLHPDEAAFLDRVSEIFGLDPVAFRRIRARHVKEDGEDPYAILGVDPDTPLEEIKRRYRALVAENHPDRLLARGVPPDFVKVANERLTAINGAWEAIKRRRRT